MQQGGQSIAAGSSPGIPQSQLIFTRAASTDAETVAPSGANNGEHGVENTEYQLLVLFRRGRGNQTYFK